MNNKLLTLALLAPAVTPTTGAAKASKTTTDRQKTPNVVIILADDLATAT